jgi:hypothetical protein
MLDFLLGSIHISMDVKCDGNYRIPFINFLHLEIMISISWSLQINLKWLRTSFSKAHKTPFLHQKL